MTRTIGLLLVLVVAGGGGPRESATLPATSEPKDTAAPAVVASLVPGAPTGSGAPPSAAPEAALPPSSTRGVASFVDPRFGSRYLALPEGPGHRVTICAAAGHPCVVRVSTDAGPDKAMQRAGRVADVSFADFRTLCGGCDPYAVGLIRVTVRRAGGIPAAPDTSTVGP